MGVVIVEVIRYAVVTHACTDSPCRSSAIVRLAVLTIVWSRAPRNIRSIRPDRIVSTWAWVYSPVSAEVALALIGSSLGRGAQCSAGRVRLAGGEHSQRHGVAAAQPAAGAQVHVLEPPLREHAREHRAAAVR